MAWIDIFTGLYGVIGIQAALAERARSGRGQQVDLALFDCALGVLANQAANHLLGGVEPVRWEMPIRTSCPIRSFRRGTAI